MGGNGKQIDSLQTNKQPLIMIPWAAVSYRSPACLSSQLTAQAGGLEQQENLKTASVVFVLIRAVTTIINSGVIIMRFQHHCLHAPTGSSTLSACVP
eukprot:CAMPEP_0206138616 /NCGR_PEP_ID=MMETSP1473-20131121/3443_1 /ASSEMBLY_ACC=CAM_ASM_001109 /TAXON_ID=1461547 /ORGANISM="Stichococcus sp, Strain RCC1054" /LENGTH=96 /DNA_ID=CAMNT_0053532093 /DNA_START=77 /DNA_END=364 /DNA_ORIENTATION=+